jgi:hypothetical protein
MLKDEVKEMQDLVNKHGECKFCHQTMVVEAPEEWEQEKVNELVLEMCECSEAKVYTSRKKRIERADGHIDRIFQAPNTYLQENGRKLLKAAVKLIAEHEIDGITMKDGDTVAKIDMNSDGDIRISGSRKLEEKAEA